MGASPRAPTQDRRETDPHRSDSWIADVVLGGQDGLVNVLGMVLGVVAATGSARVVLVAGLAAAVSGSVSMAAVAYTSTRAARDLYRSERAREYRHIEAAPQLEREEIRDIYARKGFGGELLERIVDAVTGNKDVWVAIMMTEEHHLLEVDGCRSLRSAAIVGISSLVGSLLPLGPIALLPIPIAGWAAVVVSAGTLFALGAYKARVTAGSALRSGVELATIGSTSAVIGYAVGRVLHL
jgi:VIT1/CCC1 family predicted Fe2+/Mn2+ transporter